MRITADELAGLYRRRAAPALAPASRWLPSRRGFVLLLPGRLVNPLNRKAATWHGEHGRRKAWKEKVAHALLELGYRLGDFDPRAPKRVSLLFHVARRFDPDALPSIGKPLPDALIECGVLHQDSETSGHHIEYHQIVDRAWSGIEIRVSLEGGAS